MEGRRGYMEHPPGITPLLKILDSKNLLRELVGVVFEEDVIIAAETGDAVCGATEGTVAASGTGSVVRRKI